MPGAGAAGHLYVSGEARKINPLMGRLSGGKVFDRWDIRNRILLLAALSPALVAIVAGGYLVNHRIQHIDQTWHSLGQGLAEQLAPASEYGIASLDEGMLSHLARAALGNPEVREVVIRNARGEILAQAGREAPSPATLPWLQGMLVQHTRMENSRFVAAVGMTTPVQMATMQAGRVGQIELSMSPAAMRAEQLRVGLTGGLLLLLALLASILLGLRVARGISEPVLRLAATARALREGQLSRRVPEHSGGELGSLERDINAMADAMQTGRRNLRSQVDQATSDLRTTLEELEIKHAELDIARRRAVEANRGKSGFIARMSHEIRTPVNGIVGFSRLLEQTPMNAEQSQYTRIIRSSADSLLHIINDILDFSRVEADRIVLDNRPFNLHSLIEECLAMLAPQAWEKQLQLTHMIYTDVPEHLQGDPVRLRQILTNLLANAIKFTSSGQISVRIMAEAETADTVDLAISVTDTGAGIAPADRKRIFGAFTQADDSITRKYGGTGLGLFICERLVRAMEGQIGFDSQPGEGSRFWFGVSLAKAAAAAPALPDLQGLQVGLYAPSRLARLARQNALQALGARVHAGASPDALARRHDHDICVVELTVADSHRQTTRHALQRLRAVSPVLVLVHSVDQHVHQLLCDSGASQCLPALAPREQWLGCLQLLLRATPEQAAIVDNSPLVTEAQTALSGMHILIVDDNAINRNLSALMLQRHGAVIDEATDGHRALALCALQQYHCILMDIHMPGLGGDEAAAQLLAQQARDETVPVIALTADTFAGRHGDLDQSGICECLIKPVDEITLVNTVLRHCGREPLTQSSPSDTPGASQVDPDMLRDDLREQLEGLHRAFKNNDPELARHHVHRLHGTAAFCRLQTLREAAAALETLLRHDGLFSRRAGDALARVEQELAHCLEQLQAIDGTLQKQ